MNKRQKKEAVTASLFILPSFILLFAFTILPIILTIVLSFAKYNGMSAIKWIGFKNYVNLFASKDFVNTLRNIIVYVLAVVPSQTILSLVLGAVLAVWFRNTFGELVRGTVFIPVLCSSVLAGTVFYYLFASDSEAVINSLLGIFGVEKHNWLGDRSTALMVICLTSIWKNVGYFLVIFYAGIMDVPKDYYEAASLDGASRFQQFIYITIPNIKSVIYIVVTLGTIWAFQIFDLPYVMTNGGPGNATKTPSLWLYNEAFQELHLGFACSIAVMLALVIFIVSLIQRVCFSEKAGE